MLSGNFPREKFGENTTATSLKSAVAIQKSCFLLGKVSPKRASILQEPKIRSPISLRRSITTSIDVVFSSLHFIPFESLSVCKNRENLDSSEAIAFQIKQKRNISPSFVTTPDDSGCDVHILLLLQINCTNKDMHDCSNWQEVPHRRWL